LPTQRTKRSKPPLPGQEVVDFINGLTHTGDFNGVPFELREWQEKMVRPLFGNLRPDGRRQYTKAFFALPRKNGKTELIAALVLYLMLGTGKRSQRIFSASGTAAQAALVHEAAATMIHNDPALDELCICYEGNEKKIVCKPLNTTYQALSSDAPTKHGLNPSTVVFDELHVFPNRQLYTALTTGYATRREPLTIMITTAGFDKTSLCYEKWRYAEDVRDGIIDDPEFLPIIYSAVNRAGDPEPDWKDPAVWERAMPALGDFCSREYIESEMKEAQQNPAKENEVKQLYLNLWTAQSVKWINNEAWQACGGPLDLARLKGRPCFAGLDMGLSGDMTAFARAFRDPDGGVTVLLNYWTPIDGTWRKEFRNEDRYPIWHQQGHLKYTPGNIRDRSQIVRDIVAMDDETPIQMLFADRAYATETLTDLYNDHGFQDRLKGITQGPVQMNESCVKLDELIASRKIRHGGNPVLAWNAANAVLRRNHTGLVNLDKESATERIDGLAAVLNALAAMCSEPGDDGESVYNHRGILFL
jgi:phage terminase large subunit-like protein